MTHGITGYERIVRDGREFVRLVTSKVLMMRLGNIISNREGKRDRIGKEIGLEKEIGKEIG